MLWLRPKCSCCCCTNNVIVVGLDVLDVLFSLRIFDVVVVALLSLSSC